MESSANSRMDAAKLVRSSLVILFMVFLFLLRVNVERGFL
jgi:hypothetical protein